MSTIALSPPLTPGTAPTHRAARTHRAVAGLCLGAAAMLLSACGGASTGPDGVVTVTTTPTVTARAVPPKATRTPARPGGTAKSDVVGRGFDLGTIVTVRHSGDVPVLIFDRWTARGVSDATIAAEGAPMQAHSDARFENLNSKITYRIPVARDAVFTYAHCVSWDQPTVLRSSTLEEFTRLPDPEKIVLVRLDAKGQAVKVQNDPSC
jgi:hypothetical protein